MKITIKRKQPVGNKALSARGVDQPPRSKPRPQEAHTSRMSYQKLCENLRVERRVNDALRTHAGEMLEATMHVNRALSTWRITACTLAALLGASLAVLIYVLLHA